MIFLLRYWLEKGFCIEVRILNPLISILPMEILRFTQNDVSLLRYFLEKGFLHSATLQSKWQFFLEKGFLDFHGGLR